MDGNNLTPQQIKLKELKKLFPEAFCEDKVDWEKLKATLGEDIDFSNERYVLNWAGKSQAFKTLQTPTSKTLKPAKDESVDFDNTEHVFIEGENLEVLKILQKSYFNKVKMIYIDPPYNTGNDSFIYPDKFSETLDAYQKRVGDKDEDGYLTKDGQFRKNSKENGQYHSNWLNMMYPRLFLAKNLLRQDGVIFVSIDDNEVHNLRLLMNEVFGEENFRGQIIRCTGTRMGSGNKEISSEVDYLLCFSKTDNFNFIPIPMKEKDLKIYDQKDEKGLYLTRSLRRTGGENRREDRPSMFYPVFAPDGEKILPIAPEGWESRWVCSKDTYEKLLTDNMIVWKKVKSKGAEKWQVYQKHYAGNALKYISNLWSEIDGNKKATREVNALFNGVKYFHHPKPLEFLRTCIQMSTTSNELILDFFTGSGTTQHAVMALNAEDGGNRKCISVQLPELCDEKSEAYKAGYRTIADIAKERIRRAGKKIKDENPDYQGDLGFKVLKLSDSNFKQWQSRPQSEAELKDQLALFVDPVKDSAHTEDMVYELLLKSGLDLNAKISVPTQEHGNEKTTTPRSHAPAWECIPTEDRFYIINDDELVLILETVSQELVDKVLKLKPQKVIALDRLFEGQDSLKTNTVLQFRDSDIPFETI
jgi:adenine-specific DNA-methyltransferase